MTHRPTHAAPRPPAPTPGRPPERPGFVIAGTAAMLIALAAAGIAARILAQHQWDRVVDYRSPYTFVMPVGTPTTPLTDRVVLIIVDGLRDDVARGLPTFTRLAAAGVRTTARTSEPSLSLPGWTQLVSGSPPAVSGVTTNWYEGEARIDSLFRQAALNGQAGALAGHEAWEPLFGDWLAEASYLGRDDGVSDERVAAEAVRLLDEVEPSLLVVHLPDVDTAGHGFGVGPEYAAAARRADDIIAGILEAAGEDATIVLTSDHGHVDEGGHGGPEDEVLTTPLVLAGPGIRPGARLAPVSQADVAPTIAALLGLPRPGHAVGGALPVLDAEPEVAAEIAAAHLQAQRIFSSRAATVVGRGATSLAGFDRGIRAEIRGARLIRIPMAVAAMIAIMWGVWVATRRRTAVAVAAGVLGFLATWAGLFALRGLTFSFSHFNTEEQIGRFLMARLVDAVIAGLVGGAACGAVAGWRRSPAPFRDGVAATAWMMLPLAAMAAAFFAAFGWSFEVWLPDMSAAFAEYLALLGILGLGLSGGAIGLASMGVAGLVARRHPGVD